MLDHDRARDLAAVSLDFDLTADERAGLDAHLAGCTACRRYLEDLRADARLLAERPRVDAPASVRRRVGAGSRRYTTRRLGIAAAAAAAIVVVAALAQGGWWRFGDDGGAAVVSPSVRPVSPTAAPSAQPGETASPATPRPEIPTTAWRAVDGAGAFDPAAVTPAKDTSTPPDLPCQDCGDTTVLRRAAVVRAAAADSDGFVAVGHGCFGDDWITCRANVWLSTDGLDWRAVPHDATLDAGSDAWYERPTGMVDVIAAPGAFVAGGSVSRGGRILATVWTSTDREEWQPATLEHEGDGRVGALAAGPSGLVAVGRVRGDDGVEAAVWISDGARWERVTAVGGASVGRFSGDDQDVAGMFDVTWVGDGFVAVGAECSGLSSCRVAAWTSPDGRAWERTVTAGPPGRMRSVALVGATLVAVGDDGTWGEEAGRAWTSTDATHWIIASVDAGGRRPAPLRTVVAIDAGAIAAGDGYALVSADGRSWVRSGDEALEAATVTGLAAGPLGVIACGSGGPVEIDDVWVRAPSIWLLPYR